MSDDIASLLSGAFDAMKAAGELDSALDEFMANEVVPTWQGYYPVDTGEGQDDVEVTEPATAGRGTVSATDDEANLIEYGTEDTPAFAPRAHTIEHFAK